MPSTQRSGRKRLQNHIASSGEPIVMLLDEQRRMILANCSAKHLKARGDGVRLSADGMKLARHQDDHKLQSLIDKALSEFVSPTASESGTMWAPRPSGKRPYWIFVGPISCLSLSSLRPAVCIVLIDPHRHRALPAAKIQVAFELTHAEARLAALLAAGADLRAAAAKLRITYGTARTRLGEIFQKTGTRRQSELVRLVLITLTPE